MALDIARLQIEVDTRDVARAEQKLRGFASAGARIGGDLSRYLTLPIIGFAGLTVKTAMDFEQSMNRVRAITNATGDEFETLKETARDLGASTAFSAKEAADGMSFLSMAGFEVNEVVSTMPGVLALAAAGQLDLASAADISSNVLQGFRLEVSEMNRVVDVLAATSSRSNTDIRQLGEAMSYAAPISAGFGISIEQAAAAIGVLSDAGVQGGRAGRSLQQMFIQLSSNAERLGVNVWEADGTMRDFVEVMADLGEQGLSTARIMEVMGARGGPALEILLAKGTEGLRKFAEGLNDVAGEAERMKDQQMEGLAGAVKELTSAFEELQLALADAGLIGVLEDLVDWTTDLVRAFGEMDNATRTVVIASGTLAAAVGPVLVVFGYLIPLIIRARKQMIALNLAMLANPYVAAGAAVAILATHFLTARSSADKFNDSLSDQAKALKDSKLSVDEMSKSLVQLTMNEQRQTVATALKSIGYEIEDAQRRLEKNIEAFKRDVNDDPVAVQAYVDTQLGNEVRDLKEDQRRLENTHRVYNELADVQKEINRIERTREAQGGRMSNMMREDLEVQEKRKQILMEDLGLVTAINDEQRKGSEEQKKAVAELLDREWFDEGNNRSVGEFKDRIAELEEQISKSFKTEDIVRFQGEIEYTQERLKILLGLLKEPHYFEVEGRLNIDTAEIAGAIELSREMGGVFEETGMLFRDWSDTTEKGLEATAKALKGAFDGMRKGMGETSLEIKRAVESGSILDLESQIGKLNRRMEESADPMVTARYRKQIKELERQIGVLRGDVVKTNDAARDLGFTFSSAFEDAITRGNSLRSVLEGIYQDLIRIAIRAQVTEPLGNALKSAFSSIDFFGGKQAVEETVVKDALIKSDGQIVRFDPADNILAMKDFAPLRGESGTSVNVQVINNSRSEVDVEERPDGRGGRDITMVIKEVVENLGDRGQLDRVMSRNYGLSRKGVTRG